MTPRERTMAMAVGVASVVLFVAGLLGLLVTDGDDEPRAGETATAPAPSGEATGGAPAGPERPIGDACALLAVESVARAAGLEPGNVRAQPQMRTFGAACEFIEQSEDALRIFTVTVAPAADLQQARALGDGKRVPVGDVAVFEQREFFSEIKVAKGTRNLYLRSHRRPLGEDVMVRLAQEAIPKV